VRADERTGAYIRLIRHGLAWGIISPDSAKRLASPLRRDEMP
jgi:hypothetical protein